MREITTKFKSCFEEDTLQKETVIFKTEDGKELGQVTLRQLKRSEIADLANKSPDEYLAACIERWTFKDEKGEPLIVSAYNVGLLSSAKKLDGNYALGIVENLFQVAVELNVVSEVESKNSEKQ